MVSIIDNWSEITGKIVSLSNESSVANFTEIVIKVLEVDNYKDFPNLINLPQSNKIAVKLRRTVTKSLNLKVGDKIKALVRAAGLNDYYFRQDSVRIIA